MGTLNIVMRVHTWLWLKNWDLKLYKAKNYVKVIVNTSGSDWTEKCKVKIEKHFVCKICLELVYACQSRKNAYCSSTGEVPGLYTLEELEPLLSPLKDQASQDGFFGPVFNYFTYSKRLRVHH